MGREGDQLEIVQNISPDELIYIYIYIYAQPIFCPRKWDVLNPLGFWDTNGSSNIGQTTRPSDSQQKKKKKKEKEKRDPAE